MIYEENYGYENVKNLFGKTKNGQLIPLKLMSEEHLENAINYFDRMEVMREIVLENQDILNL